MMIKLTDKTDDSKLYINTDNIEAVYENYGYTCVCTVSDTEYRVTECVDEIIKMINDRGDPNENWVLPWGFIRILWGTSK